MLDLLMESNKVQKYAIGEDLLRDWMYTTHETNKLLAENNNMLRRIDEKLRITSLSGYD
jgi:hypothetical protein